MGDEFYKISKYTPYLTLTPPKLGRIGKFECDFILHRDLQEYAYIQVAMTIMDSLKTEDREYRPLESIMDNYPKYLVTRNDLIQHRNGILHVNIAPFMKQNREF